MPLYDWKNAPEWANYAARDFNGFALWFENKPELLTIVLGVPGLLAGFGTTLAITQAVADSKIDAVNKDG